MLRIPLARGRVRKRTLFYINALILAEGKDEMFCPGLFSSVKCQFVINWVCIVKNIIFRK